MYGYETVDRNSDVIKYLLNTCEYLFRGVCVLSFTEYYFHFSSFLLFFAFINVYFA